jgi:NitT/TauT family transport system substrate-binding protein
MKNTIFQLRCLAVFIFALLIVPGNPQAQTAEKVRIAIASHSLAFLVPFVAKDRGLYAKHGIEAELIQVRPNVAMAALLSGDIDYVELIGSIIRSAGKGAPVRAISTSIKAPFFSFAANSKFKTIKDLKGATIGVTAIGGTNYVSTRLTLRHYGLDPDKGVRILAIGDEKLMYETFKIGRVDSVVVAPPFFGDSKARRFSSVGPYGRAFELPVFRPRIDPGQDR